MLCLNRVCENTNNRETGLAIPENLDSALAIPKDLELEEAEVNIHMCIGFLLNRGRLLALVQPKL